MPVGFMRTLRARLDLDKVVFRRPGLPFFGKWTERDQA